MKPRQEKDVKQEDKRNTLIGCGCTGIILVGLLGLSIWLIRGCTGKDAKQKTFQTVEAEIESRWQEWNTMSVTSGDKRLQEPILVVTCQFLDEDPRAPISKKGVQKGVHEIRYIAKKFEHPVARTPDDLRTLVVVLEEMFPDETWSTSKKSWLNRPLGPTGGPQPKEGVLKCIIMDWPTREVIEKKEIPPCHKREVRSPGAKLGKFTVVDVRLSDWEKCWEEIRVSLAKRLPPKAKD